MSPPTPQAPQLLREEDILTSALAEIRKRLPTGWRMDLKQQNRQRRPDAIVTLTATDGTTSTLVVEAKRSLATRDLPAALAQINDYIEGGGLNDTDGPAVPLVVARYLAAPLQAWLGERDVAFADATGNLRLTLDRPALFLRDVGATKDPWRGPGRPKGNLIGEPAAKVVRALIDYTPPYTVPQLVKLSGASTGPTYRVVEFLAEQALIERPERGPIEQVRWRELLVRWSLDYGFLRANQVTTHLALRGLPTFIKQLADTPRRQDLRYVVTGSLAAQQWAPYAQARAAMLYCDNPELLAKAIDLRPVDTGANVLLARSAYDVVYDRMSSVDGVDVVAPSQAAVDLLTGPGRNPAEGEALLDWMEANLRDWRR